MDLKGTGRGSAHSGNSRTTRIETIVHDKIRLTGQPHSGNSRTTRIETFCSRGYYETDSEPHSGNSRTTRIETCNHPSRGGGKTCPTAVIPEQQGLKPLPRLTPGGGVLPHSGNSRTTRIETDS